MGLNLTRRSALGGFAAVAANPGASRAAERLKVVCFPGAVSLPLVVAIERGHFEEQCLSVVLTFTPSSSDLRNGLANGRFDVAHAAVDNAVAMQETAKVPISVIVGGDNGFNRL